MTKTRFIANTLSLAAVAAALATVIEATLTREMGPVEGIMLWKAGLLGLGFFAFRMFEAGTPHTISILGDYSRE